MGFPGAVIGSRVKNDYSFCTSSGYFCNQKDVIASLFWRSALLFFEFNFSKSRQGTADVVIFRNSAGIQAFARIAQRSRQAGHGGHIMPKDRRDGCTTMTHGRQLTPQIDSLNGREGLKAVECVPITTACIRPAGEKEDTGNDNNRRANSAARNPSSQAAYSTAADALPLSGQVLYPAPDLSQVSQPTADHLFLQLQRSCHHRSPKGSQH